jgi:hypothetical protein
VREAGDDQRKTATEGRGIAERGIISANRLHRKWIGVKKMLITAFNPPRPQD